MVPLSLLKPIQQACNLKVKHRILSLVGGTAFQLDLQKEIRDAAAAVRQSCMSKTGQTFVLGLNQLTNYNDDCRITHQRIGLIVMSLPGDAVWQDSRQSNAATVITL